jgi:hypothetical protein
MNKQGTHSGRYLVRQGIKDWMVWDRRAKGPVKTDRGRATGLLMRGGRIVIFRLRCLSYYFLHYGGIAGENRKEVCLVGIL